MQEVLDHSKCLENSYGLMCNLPILSFTIFRNRIESAARRMETDKPCISLCLFAFSFVCIVLPTFMFIHIFICLETEGRILYVFWISYW